MSAIRVGDRVRCTQPGVGNHIAEGSTYTVTSIEGDLLTLDHGGPALAWRFKLVTPAAATQATKILDDPADDGWWGLDWSELVINSRDPENVTAATLAGLGLEVRVQVRRVPS